MFQSKGDCKECYGVGRCNGMDGVRDTCPSCRGTGHALNKEELMEATIKSMLRDRQEIDALMHQLIGNEEFRILLHSIGNSSPIMQWAKDINGVYTYMNQALCDHLYYGSPEDLVGLNDMQIIEKHLAKYPKHNFGSICMGTDQMVIDTDKPMKFFEWGHIGDKDNEGAHIFQYVTAYKNTYKDRNGKILGSCGLAIYMTDEVNEIVSIMETCTDESTKAKLALHLRRYGFGCDNTFSDINIDEIWKKGK